MERDEPMKSTQKNKGDASKVSNKPDKPDSVFLANELIVGEDWGKRLSELRQIKTISLNKFSERIHNNIQKLGFSIRKSQEIFIGISNAANEQNTTGHQMASIFNGFATYWTQC